jgi:hypothetical protein
MRANRQLSDPIDRACPYYFYFILLRALGVSDNRMDFSYLYIRVECALIVDEDKWERWRGMKGGGR